MTKRVAIIGAGSSGLAAIKCCLDEGLTPVCFERSDEAGGLWLYRDDQGGDPDQGSVLMKSTVVHTSKEMLTFSDFPVPAHFPNYMHHSTVWRYLQQYGCHFRLHPHIRFNTEVTSVARAEDYDSTGRWDVTVVGHPNGDVEGHESTETYDAVLVCTGHHTEKHVPSFPGLEDFEGQVLHSHHYRDPAPFIGKTVLIVGIGNSGGDLAVELSRSGQVLLSTRRGTWIIHRLSQGNRGMPVDLVNTRRLWLSLLFSLPASVRDFLIKNRLNRQVDHDLYGLTPSYSPLAQHPFVNDDLTNRIACGSVVIKGDVEEFTSTGVRFKDGSFVDKIDVVLLATGYTFSLPFLEHSLAESVRGNRLPFYLYMFPPHLPHPTLATIGFVQPLGGGVNPVAEMQCRLATKVFKGEVRLPSSADMDRDISLKEAAMAQRYVTSLRHTLQVDYISYMDQLADLIGCKPQLVPLLKRDLSLAWHVYTGPCAPYQYRLLGPGTWAGARQAIMGTMGRVRCPLASRPLPALSDADRVRQFFDRLMMLFVFMVLVSIIPR